MKKWLFVLMLVIMGERWERVLDGLDYALHCGPPTVCVVINDYRHVYVIGKDICADARMTCPGIHIPPVEVFTIPVPNVPTKTMTKDEAEKANQEFGPK